MKNKFSSISGLTLIEILIGIVISSLMMAAIYTSYSVVNSSYSQVMNKASISSSSRDVISMMVRELRMAGFKYFGDTLKFDDGTSIKGEHNNHYPIIIKEKGTHTGAGNLCCDRIEIVYGDYDLTSVPKFKRYKVIYFGAPDDAGTPSNTKDDFFNLYKAKQRWDNENEVWKYVFGGTDISEFDGAKPPSAAEAELLRKYLVEMEFVAVDENGKRVPPLPCTNCSLTVSENRELLTEIRSVDVKLTFRSKKQFYKKNKVRRIVESIRGNARNVNPEDRYLRDSVVVTINTRNIGAGG